jgi:hypothetical protein
MAIRNYPKKNMWSCLSTDDKPTLLDGAKAGDELIEFNINSSVVKKYLFDGDDNWVEYIQSTNTEIEIPPISVEIDAIPIKDGNSENTATVDVNGNLSVRISEELPVGTNKIGSVDSNLQIGDSDVSEVNPIPITGSVDSNLQIGNNDVGVNNPVPVTGEVGVESLYQDVSFHFESATPNSGLEFEVEAYKILRIQISGTSTSRIVMFRGILGDVNVALLGIKAEDFSLGTSTSANDEIWEFDVTGYEKVYFGLPSVEGGYVTIKGRIVA